MWWDVASVLHNHRRRLMRLLAVRKLDLDLKNIRGTFQSEGLKNKDSVAFCSVGALFHMQIFYQSRCCSSVGVGKLDVTLVKFSFR